MNRMTLSQRGIDFIKGWESCKLLAYQDTRGVWTIGWGHTGHDVAKGVRWSQSEADSAFMRDVEWASDAVNELVRVPLAQNQFDALTSFVFNCGKQNFKLSSLLTKVNGQDFVGAAAQFRRWNKEHVNGQLRVNAGLTNRRAAERDLFNAYV